ncbi:hypothetical protein ACS0TY_010667 [Phlomoides rotata]
MKLFACVEWYSSVVRWDSENSGSKNHNSWRVVCLCCFFAYVFKFSVIGLEPFKSVKVQYGDDVRLSMPYVLPLPLLFFWISNMQQDHANKESRCILKN